MKKIFLTILTSGTRANNKLHVIRIHFKVNNMKTITIFLTRIYRSVLPSSAHEEIVWKDLKNLFDKMQWRFGVFEKEKHIESSFEIDKDISSTFHYMIYNENHHCRTLVANKYPTHLTSNIFILASHFNNLLQTGRVKINVDDQYIEYHTKCDLLLPLLYPGELRSQITRHYGVSKDIYWAFQKLIFENEEPPIIIADLLKMKETEKKNLTDD